MLTLAAGGHGPRPNLLFASAHFLLLSGELDPLGAFYPSVSGSSDTAGDPFPAFRRFCLTHATPIRGLMETRLVQTNEVARCAVLLPGLQAVAAREPDRPLALVEVGASAGLLLLWDHYAYAFDNRRVGPDSPVEIQCALRGAVQPPLPPPLPGVTERVGIDLNPLDVRDADAARWLQALIWPDQLERAERLRRATGIVAQFPPRLISGDALATLPGVLAGVNPRAAICVFHAHTLNQFGPTARQAFRALLQSRSTGRPVYELSMEYLAGEPAPRLDLFVFQHGAEIERHLLAHYDAHGDWLEWHGHAPFG